MKRVTVSILAAMAILGALWLHQVGYSTLLANEVTKAPQTAPKANQTPLVVRTVEEFPKAYVRQAEQAVFSVHSYTDRFEQVSSGGGTGFYVETAAGAKYILTNRHVCEMDTPGGYYLLRQGAAKFVAKLISMSSYADLCVLTPPRDITLTRKPYQLSLKRLNPGDLVAAFGHPFLRPLTSTVGEFINETREPINMVIPGFSPADLINIGRSDMMIFPGNSGSPVIDITGDVVGIVFAYEGPGKAGLFVPVSEIRDFLETHE